MRAHPLTNFKIQKYYQNETKFNGSYSRNNSPKIKDGAYVINLDQYELIGTRWIALQVNANKIVCFDSLAVEHIPKQIKKSIRNKNIKNICRRQAYDC